MKKSEAFAAMRERAYEVGWVQGALKVPPDGPECLNGLAWSVVKKSKPRFDALRNIMVKVAITQRGIAPTRVNDAQIKFNDSPGTGFNDIIEFINDCELVAKEQEARRLP